MQVFYAYNSSFKKFFDTTTEPEPRSKGSKGRPLLTFTLINVKGQ